MPEQNLSQAQATVDRLRQSKADREKREAADQFARDLQRREHEERSREAGRTWASEQASESELVQLAATKTAKDQGRIVDPRRRDGLYRSIPAMDGYEFDAFIQGAVEVWHEFKDQL